MESQNQIHVGKESIEIKHLLKENHCSNSIKDHMSISPHLIQNVKGGLGRENKKIIT